MAFGGTMNNSLRIAIALALACVAVNKAAAQDAPTIAKTAPAKAAMDTQKSTPASGAQESKPKPDPQQQCVQPDEFAVELKSGRHPVGDTIVLPSTFLPTDQRVEVGIRTPYVNNLRYFAAIDRNQAHRRILARQDVVTRRAVASDGLVKSESLEADQTIISIALRNSDAGWWQKSDLYLYTCSDQYIGPARVSRINVRLSPYWQSLFGCALVTLIAYLVLGLAMRKRDDRLAGYLGALNPVKLSSGPDGRGSLSKFQVLLFSLLVFALIVLFMLKTGMLSELSGTILTLLGINGLGATIAKGADANRNTLTGENYAWLLQRGWIQARRDLIDNSQARWSDFFTTNGEFDVYRYQSFLFSVAVAFAMVAAGIGQLSSFVIPDTVLGIVGLSQAVYIGGKLVTRTNMTDLNAAIADLRGREKKLRDTAVTALQNLAAGTPVPGAQQLVGAGLYADYRAKAGEAATFFAVETGIVVADQNLEPRLG